MKIENNSVLEKMLASENNISFSSAEKVEVKVDKQEKIKFLQPLESPSYPHPKEVKEEKTKIATYLTEEGGKDFLTQQWKGIGNQISDHDLLLLTKSGFIVEDMDAEAIVTEVDKIKIQLAKAGKDVSWGDSLSKEQLLAQGESISLEKEMEQAYQQEDVPLTKENLLKGKEALQMAERLTPLSKGSVKYMVENALPPTIENLYRAQFSGSVVTSDQNTTTDADSALNLKKEIEQVITQTGNEINKESIDRGNWMVNENLFVTPNQYQYVVELESMILPQSIQEVAKAVAIGVKEGQEPQKAALLPSYSLTNQAQEAVEVLELATLDPKIVEIAAEQVSTKEAITVNQLKQALFTWRVQLSTQEKTDQVMAKSTENEDVQTVDEAKELKQITFLRQIEEARLYLTKESCIQMQKQGIDINTTKLETLVETLRQKEANYHEKLLLQVAGTGVTKEQGNLLGQTNQILSEVKTHPAYILGQIKIKSDGLNTLHQMGKELAQELQKANSAYETLMTQVRSDLGDTIQKAFTQVDGMLKEMSLPITEENKRAVRILAYNQLQITEESVAEIKLADKTMQNTFARLTPPTVTEMIQQGINPLSLSLEELNEQAIQINSQSESAKEKFSEYLWKLEKNNELSASEREAYIGIYRLIHQVEVSDGAPLGALVAQGANLTMENLLMAIRSGKKAGMDYTVNDSFAGIEENEKKASISEQINQGFIRECAKEIQGKFTPEIGKILIEQDSSSNFTPEQLLEQLQNIEVSSKEEEAKTSYRNEKINEFRQAIYSEKEVYQLLENYQVPVTGANLMAASRMLTGRNQVFQRLLGEANAQKRDSEAVDLAELIDPLGESKDTKESLQLTQLKLTERMKEIERTAIEESTTITSLDLKELKIMNSQIHLMEEMAKDETYSIPVKIGEEITNISLKIIRKGFIQGQVDVYVETTDYGKIAARTELTSQGIKGMIFTDQADTGETISQAIQQGEFQFLEEPIDYQCQVLLQLEGEKTFGLLSDRKEDKEKQKEASAEPSQTKRLYEIGKGFLETVNKILNSSDIRTE